MRYRRLGYFVAVAEELSFTRAAERLHMAQPPLSQQIALLEKDLGVPLFDRSRRAIRLTPAGAALLPEARRLLADVEETARRVRSIGEGTVGGLTVGFVPTAMNGPLPRLLRGYRAGYPGVELILRELPPDRVLRAVREGGLDVGLLYHPFDGSELAERPLAREPLMLALPEGHPVAKSETIRLADVREEPFVLPEQHEVPGIHAAVTATFADAGIAPRVAQRGVWLMQSVLGLVAAGIGLALVPASLATLGRQGVVLRPVEGPEHAVELVAVSRPDGSAQLSGFLSLIDNGPVDNGPTDNGPVDNGPTDVSPTGEGG